MSPMMAGPLSSLPAQAFSPPATQSRFAASARRGSDELMSGAPRLDKPGSIRTHPACGSSVHTVV